MIAIADPQDLRVEDYREVRERDLVGRRGLFIAEGEVVLDRLLRAPGFETVSVLLDEKRAPRIVPKVAELRPGVPVFVASQAVMDTLVGFPIHRGVLAVGRRPQPPSATSLLAGLGRDALVVVLMGLSNHDNVGGVFRNAAAFGTDAVLLDPSSCDPLYRKAVRVSVGASLIVPFARLEPGEDVIELLGAQGFETYALSPSGARTLLEIDPGRRTAALFGAEGPGLPRPVLERAAAVRIPMAPGFDSLNVATSSGIVMHWLRAGRPAQA